MKTSSNKRFNEQNNGYCTLNYSGSIEGKSHIYYVLVRFRYWRAEQIAIGTKVEGKIEIFVLLAFVPGVAVVIA